MLIPEQYVRLDCWCHKQEQDVCARASQTLTTLYVTQLTALPTGVDSCFFHANI